MEINSFTDAPDFKGRTVHTKVIFETPFSKEIRICMKEGHVIKEHKTPFPIVVHVYEGDVDFGVNGETVNLPQGSAISLEGGVPHDLTARKDTKLRLTLSKGDQVARVEKVAAD